MPESTYTCILWDVDGTIADASAGILPRLRQVFASYGLAEPDPDALSLWIGPPMLESFQLRAGMPADVLVPLRKRTALDYFLEPLTAQFWGSFREQ